MRINNIVKIDKSKNDNLIIIKYNDIVDKNIINKYNNIYNCTNNDYNIKELICLINMLLSKNFSIYSILICDNKYKFNVHINNYPSISTVYFEDLIYYDDILYIARTNNDKKNVKRMLKIKNLY